MKRFIGLMLSLIMTLGLIACGEETGVPSGEITLESGNIDPDAPSYKIIYMYGNFTDALGTSFKSSMEYISSVTNVEILFVEGSSGEDGIAALEAAVAAGGIDGIVLQAAPSSAFLEAARGIPLVAAGNAPASDQEAKEVSVYENFLGCVIDSNFDAGYDAAKALYDNGARNVCFAGLTQGMTRTHDDRAAGFLKFVEENPDMKLLADDYTRGLFANSIQSFAAAFPEMDGIFTSALNDAVLNTMRTENLVGDVKLAGVDVSSETGNYFDNNTLIWCAGGQVGTPMVAFAILYNYLLDGIRIIEDTSVFMSRYFIKIHNAEEFNMYNKALSAGVPVYLAGDIKNMIHRYNSDVDYDYFMELAESYKIEDIVARQQAYLE